MVNVPVPTSDDCWRLPMDENTKLLDKFIIRVGGKEDTSSSGDDADSDVSATTGQNAMPQKKRQPDPTRLDVVFHHEIPLALALESLHCCSIKAS